jgi:hypothetical protein
MSKIGQYEPTVCRYDAKVAAQADAVSAGPKGFQIAMETNDFEHTSILVGWRTRITRTTTPTAYIVPSQMVWLRCLIKTVS